MITISRSVTIADNEVSLSGIRAQGAGGQHVNKASTAIHLRFDIKASSLPEFYKETPADFQPSLNFCRWCGYH